MFTRLGYCIALKERVRLASASRTQQLQSESERIMIASKLEQAKDTVGTWVSINKGQAGFEWMFEMLTKQSDQDAAVELSLWWGQHPANPNRLLGA
jgi:hypothetical protein